MTRTKTRPATRNRFDDLLTVLARIETLHQELGAVLAKKLEYTRTARLADLQSCTERERTLAVRLHEQHGLRKQLMEQVGKALGLAADAARGLSLKNLMARLPEPQRGRLQAVADRLRTIAELVSGRNQVLERVTAQILEHLRSVCDTLVAVDGPVDGYTARGQVATAKPRELFEVVG